MEKVIAYKAFNGRLFESEDKCITYENKMAQYPKVKEELTYAEDAMIFPGKYKPTNIVKHCIHTWATPSAQRKDEIFYIVNDVYKFTGCCEDNHMLCGVLESQPVPDHDYLYYYMIDRAVARLAFTDKGITDDTINEIVDKYHQLDKHSKISVETIIPNKKWIIGDKRWYMGAIKMCEIVVEKIK